MERGLILKSGEVGQVVMATNDALNITMAKEREELRERATHGTVVDASSAASGGTVPSEVSAVSISSM